MYRLRSSRAQKAPKHRPKRTACANSGISGARRISASGLFASTAVPPCGSWASGSGGPACMA
eukprot:4089841-Alexandrium_andersonii.AAC.1